MQHVTLNSSDRKILQAGCSCVRASVREIRAVRSVYEWRAVHSLRYECFVAECGFASTEADHENRLLGDALDALSTTLIAMEDGKVTATVRFQIEGLGSSPHRDLFQLDHWEAQLGVGRFGVVSKLAVESTFRGSRVTVAIVSAAFRALLHQGAWVGLLGCHPRLERFYRRLGCRPFGDLQEVRGVGPIQAMRLDLLDVGHLTAVRSPFECIAREFIAQTPTLAIGA